MAADKPFGGGRYSAAGYQAFIRSALRKASMRWAVKDDVLVAARRPAQNRDYRSKYEYQCASCGGWWIKRDIQVDHIVPVGNMDDMNAFISRLFCEADNLQVLCKGCHGAKTKASG